MQRNQPSVVLGRLPGSPVERLCVDHNTPHIALTWTDARQSQCVSSSNVRTKRMGTPPRDSESVGGDGKVGRSFLALCARLSFSHTLSCKGGRVGDGRVPRGHPYPSANGEGYPAGWLFL